MYYYCPHFRGNTTFESAGIFSTHSPWIHTARTISSYELILVIEGTFSLIIGDTPRELHPGEFLVVPPDMPHAGIQYADPPVRFFWFHFRSREFSLIREPDELFQAYRNTDPRFVMVLPEYSNRLNMHNLYSMCTHLIHINQAKASSQYLNNYTNSILYEINHETCLQFLRDYREVGSLQPIQEWIRIHASESVTLEQIAREFQYNPSYLSRKYKEEMGISIKEQISRYRIEQAKWLLASSSLSIQEIAYETGFNDPKYFMRKFKQLEQNTPTEYRHTFFQRHYNQS